MNFYSIAHLTESSSQSIDDAFHQTLWRAKVVRDLHHIIWSLRVPIVTVDQSFLIPIFWKFFLLLFTASSTTRKTTLPTLELTSASATKTDAPVTVTVPPTTMIPKTTQGGSFVCPGNGTYPDPAQCSNYYVCDNGTAFLFVRISLYTQLTLTNYFIELYS